MDTELRKRLEEAAEEYCSKYDFEPTQRNITDSGWEYGHTYTQLVKCFLAGAEHGYKEAIAQAREWLKKHLNYVPMEAFLADFESDMNILLEEKK